MDAPGHAFGAGGQRRLNDPSERMHEAMRALESILPPGTGIVLLAMDVHGENRRTAYAANVQREGVLQMMEEFLGRQRDPNVWGKHIEL